MPEAGADLPSAGCLPAWCIGIGWKLQGQWGAECCTGSRWQHLRARGAPVGCWSRHGYISTGKAASRSKQARWRTWSWWYCQGEEKAPKCPGGNACTTPDLHCIPTLFPGSVIPNTSGLDVTWSGPFTDCGGKKLKVLYKTLPTLLECSVCHSINEFLSSLGVKNQFIFYLLHGDSLPFHLLHGFCPGKEETSPLSLTVARNCHKKIFCLSPHHSLCVDTFIFLPHPLDNHYLPPWVPAGAFFPTLQSCRVCLAINLPHPLHKQNNTMSLV